MEYWNDILTEKSWQQLQRLKKKFNFILIGGWAVFLWAKTHKSKDIDLIVDFEVLEKLKKQFNLRKNERLKKYEFKKNGIDVDVYVPFYSKLAFPLQHAKSLTTEIKGFTVLKPEPLVILKQAAEIKRKHSVKGLKDRIDIIEILMKTDFDFKEYNSLLKRFKIEYMKNELKRAVSGFTEVSYLNINLHEFKKIKLQILEKLKHSSA